MYSLPSHTFFTSLSSITVTSNGTSRSSAPLLAAGALIPGSGEQDSIVTAVFFPQFCAHAAMTKH
jgi:hypothetical protein